MCVRSTIEGKLYTIGCRAERTLLSVQGPRLQEEASSEWTEIARQSNIRLHRAVVHGACTRCPHYRRGPVSRSCPAALLPRTRRLRNAESVEEQFPC